MGKEEIQKRYVSLPEGQGQNGTARRNKPRRRSKSFAQATVIENLSFNGAVTSTPAKDKKKNKKAVGEKDKNKLNEEDNKLTEQKTEKNRKKNDEAGSKNDCKYESDKLNDKEKEDERKESESGGQQITKYVFFDNKRCRVIYGTPCGKIHQTVISEEELLINNVDLNGLDINELCDEDQDDPKANENLGEANDEREEETNVDDKSVMSEEKGYNKGSEKVMKETERNRKPEQLGVNIPSDDNRRTEERESQDMKQEETKVKTFISLLTLDSNKTDEPEESTEEKKDLPKELINSYFMPCRPSIDSQEENCVSFLSGDCLVPEGVENSCFSTDDSCLHYPPSQMDSEDDDSCQSTPSLENKSDALWEITRKNIGSGGEKKDLDENFTSLRSDDFDDEAEDMSNHTEDGEELSEKEKMSLEDDKDECVDDYEDESLVEQGEEDVTAEINRLPVEIYAQSEDTSIINHADIVVGEDNQEENGSNEQEDVKCIKVEEPESEVADAVTNVLVLSKFPQNNKQIDGISDIYKISDIDSASSVDALYCCIAYNIYRQWGWVTHILLLAQVVTGTKRHCTKCLLSDPQNMFKSLEASSSNGNLGDQNLDPCQERLKERLCKNRQKKHAYVKRPKKDSFIEKPHAGGAGGSRRSPWLTRVGKTGRKCSEGSGGSTGGGFHHNSGGSDKKGSGDHGQSDSNNDGGSGRNRDNNFGGNSGNSGRDGSHDGRGNRKRPSQSDPEDENSNVPDPDFKHFKKKHSTITFEEFMSYLGQLLALIEGAKGPVWDIHNPVPECLSLSLEIQDELSDELLNCDVCNILHSMLKHFADCQEQYNMCRTCIQMFSFICIHTSECKKSQYVCGIALCVKFHHVLGEDTVHGRMKCLWFNIKKKLARVLGYDDGVLTSTSHFPVNPPNIPSVGGTHSFTPSLVSIPENTEGSSSRSGSRVLARKRSSKLPSVQETESLPPDRPVSGELADSTDQATAADQAAQLPSEEMIYQRKPPRKKISASRYTSMPVQGGIEGLHGQYPSFTDKPVGTPGICEVMYGNVQQLVVVSKNWSELKAMFQKDEPLPRRYREEGIILRPFQEHLLIDGIRYQIDFQWLKVSHLGNGMSGKCHLANDFQTEFKFCVKEIHISNFEVQEIELWSDLDHPYIVKLYGAIRHGEMIYIFSEFIDGGNLTEAINIQRALNRRLSHKTALMYFKQLLEVLEYLKRKNILHEDLKADNILLQPWKESVLIKVTDFGLATRINTSVRPGTKPVGTMTQWSPEKAECVGYGYAAEVWAAVCVLVHMVSGLPPWMRRYGGLKSLIVVIVKQSPPVEDIPRNIPQIMKDLIMRGFTVCQGQRPSAEELLRHEAFRLITNAKPRNDAYSILDSTFYVDNTELEDKNSELQEIIRGLDQKRKKSSIANVETSFQGPAEAPVITVNMLHGLETGSQPSSQSSAAIGDENVAGTTTGGQIVNTPSEGQEVVGLQSTQNENPLRHYRNFIQDDINMITDAESNVMPYQPGGSSRLEVQEVPVQIHQLDGHVLRALLPDFDQLLASSADPAEGTDNDSESDDIETKSDDAVFDLKAAIRQVSDLYLSTSGEDTTDPSLSAIPLTVQSPENPEIAKSPTNPDAGTSQTCPDAGPEGESFPSGDELFESGPGDEPELSKRFENLSMGNFSGPSGSDSVKTLIGSGQSKSDSSAEKEPGSSFQRPVFPPMCTPSRSADFINAHLLPTVQRTSGYNKRNLTLTPFNNNRQQFNPSLLPETGSEPNIQLVTLTRASAQPLTINRPQQSHYPYSFTDVTAKETPNNPINIPVSQSSPSLGGRYEPDVGERQDDRIPGNPRPEVPVTAFVLGPQSGTSSSGSQGDVSSSPIAQTQGATSPCLQFSVTDTQLSNVTPQTQPGHSSVLLSSTPRYFMTSTPVQTPRKGKEEKDAMNEMLKSYQAAHGTLAEEATDPVPGTSPSNFSQQQIRQNLRITVPSTNQPAGPVPHVQSAPTFQRTPSYPHDHQRVSQGPHSATPLKGGTHWLTESQGSGSASTSTRSQFEEQRKAFAELEKELETSSHHSHSESNLHMSWLERGDENYEDDEPGEDRLSSEDHETARETIMRQYTSDSNEEKVTVTFVCENREVPVVMKFSNCRRTWRDILQEDLCRSVAIHSLFGCERFCLRFESETTVDLNMPLGEVDLTILVVPGSKDDQWFVEGGQLFF